MSIQSYIVNVERYRKDIADLNKKIANKKTLAAQALQKANKAEQDANKSKVASTVRSKQSEQAREYKKYVELNNEIARLEKTKADKEKKLNSEDNKLSKAKEAEEKKLLKQRKQYETKNERTISNLISTVNEVKKKQEKLNDNYPLLTVPIDEAYDVFISHASEDKKEFVDHLVQSLKDKNINVWYDTDQLTWGKSVRTNIDKGLYNCKFAIVVISEYYISKTWTRREFNALYSFDKRAEEFILPIWHNISEERVREFSPMLMDNKAMKSNEASVEEMANLFVGLLNDYNS